MNAQHIALHPFQGHLIEDGKQGGISQLFVACRAHHIAAGHNDIIQKSVIMVPENRDERVILCKGVDDLDRFLRLVTPVQDIPKVDDPIDVPERFRKYGAPDAGSKRSDCTSIGMHIRKEQ
jgi:hypothetical protein